MKEHISKIAPRPTVVIVPLSFPETVVTGHVGKTVVVGSRGMVIVTQTNDGKHNQSKHEPKSVFKKIFEDKLVHRVMNESTYFEDYKLQNKHKRTEQQSRFEKRKGFYEFVVSYKNCSFV
jgi:hypothetical protein